MSKMPGGGAAKNPSESGEEFTYDSYLKIPELLSCQKLVSGGKTGKPKHDEHLFIIIHQAYELWFKQVLHELDSVREFFQEPDETKTGLMVNRLERVVLIMKLLLNQFYILETMTPPDFLEFRGYLFGGSGFQSLQFRLLENTWGVNMEKRIKDMDYTTSFKDPESKRKLEESLKTENPSMLKCVEKWLERTLDLTDDADFRFWENYERGARQWLKDTIPEQSKSYEKQKKNFDEIFGEEACNGGHRSLNHRALQGALLISVYRDEPRFSQPFKMLTLITDIDALITKWRFNHVMMVQRMIGGKVGTGGSSGYAYLQETLKDEHGYRVFVDLFNLANYLVPRDYVPKLTDSMKKQLSLTCATKQDYYGKKLRDDTVTTGGASTKG